VRYLIDTTVLIPYFAGDQNARNLIKRLLTDGIAVSILAYLEAYQGVIESADPVEARRKFDAFFDGVPILPVSPAVARRCAELRSLLKRQGKNPRRRAFDLVIAATALEHGLALVTHNEQDYRDIPDLIRSDPGT
jgi:predicted nucleic acid-binding protein